MQRYKESKLLLTINRVQEIVKTIYQIEYKLPNSRQIRTKHPKMDDEHGTLYPNLAKMKIWVFQCGKQATLCR